MPVIWRLIAVFSAAILSGCVSARPIILPDGTRGQIIRCGGTARDMGSCYEKAGKICPTGYNIEQQNESNGIFVNPVSGMAFPTVNRSLIIQCK
jgi:hypothetical protein